jgi:hypothetical protein
MKKNRLLGMAQLALLLSAVLFIFGFGDALAKGQYDDHAKGQYDDQLIFNPTAYTTVTVTVDGVAMTVRQYKIVYVAKPVKMALLQPKYGATGYMGDITPITDPYQYQTMYVSVPEASVSDQKTAIYLLVNNSGWKPSAVSTKITAGKVLFSTTDTDNIGAALKAGYIVVEPGTRSRELKDDYGFFAGKAPAVVVDTKAVIRYLRLNDNNMPGSAERIVLTGTSGGGALSVAVAASGNSPDYCSYLSEVGAAGVVAHHKSCTSTIEDDVFATVAYCPINNLGNSDIAYEWQYNAVRNDTNTGALNGIPYSAGQQPAASAAIASSFPRYLKGLHLKLDNKTALNAANMPGEIVAQVKAETERQIAKGTAIPAIGEYFALTNRGVTKYVLNDWLTVTGTGTGRTVTNIDYAKYVNFVATNQALKTVVAFDSCGVTDNAVGISGESTLYGSVFDHYSNFSEWSWNNNNKPGDGTGFDDTGFNWAAWIHHDSLNNLAKQLKMTNPIPYLDTKHADAAPYWYIRHGMVDRDTAPAIQIMLYYAVKNDPTVKDVNFKLPWMTNHGGNYDVQEAFTWIKDKLDANAHNGHHGH